MTLPSFHILLDTYLACYPHEYTIVRRVRDLVQTYPDAFYRTCTIGHITGSAWIVSADGAKCLLTHHRKLDRWLQLGGHADGETAVHQVALREAQEESGMNEFSFVDREGNQLYPNQIEDTLPQLIPLDIDIHPIPARKEEPAHEHYDLRYLLIAAPNQPLQLTSESNDLRWFGWEEIAQVTDEATIQRMIEKAQAIL